MKKINKYFFITILAFICVFGFAGCGLNVDTNTQDWGEWSIATAASCETDGIETRTSKSDSTRIETRTIEAYGHNWGEWEITTNADCMVAGVETRFCKYCGNFDVQPIPALDHDWGDWEITTMPTCHTTGIETQVCKHNDNHTDIRSITALNHDWSEWVITAAPTCETKGEETRFCRNDNHHTETRPVEELGHDWSEWVTSIPATESIDGEEMRVCRNDKTHAESRTTYATGTPGLTFVSTGSGQYNVRNSIERTQTTIYIPAYHNGLPVTEIAANGFASSQCESIIFLRDNFGKHLITSIGQSAFMNCKKLKNIEIPESVNTIGGNAFSFCSLESIEIPANVANIIGNPFMRCDYLTSISVSSNNSFYKVDGNCLIEIATNRLIKGLDTGVIPNYVTSIGRYAFAGTKIDNIIIPASVIRINGYAFSFCYNLTDIYFAGTKMEWAAALEDDTNILARFTVHCSDGIY